MKFANPFSHALIALLLASAAGTALAQAPADSHDNHASHGSHHTSAPAPAAPPAQASQTAPGEAAAAAAAATSADDLSEGEITRWDPRTLKLSLRHGDIKNLGMPPMSMVFRVPDAAVVGSLQPGDKVRFRAEQVKGAYTVTRVEAAR